MGRNNLDAIDAAYDVIVIGSGLGGLTAANQLAKCGHKVLLLEQHYQLGGLATWFRRKGGHIFDISLHGFPSGMIKSCRKYWTKEIADAIVQVKNIRFSNPQFKFTTLFDKADFSEKLHSVFGVGLKVVDRFFETLRSMNFYDGDELSTRALFERFFPGRNDIARFLLEPIAYANGSSEDDPALTYGIVFSNFMNKGVYIFKGGTDQLISKMVNEVEKNGVVVRICANVEKIIVEGGSVKGTLVNGREIRANAVVSNASLKGTVLKLVGREHFDENFLREADAVRLNNSSTQVYLGVKSGERIPDIGDLVFHSTSEHFSSDGLLESEGRSRTFSVYYPDMRPARGRATIVSSTNARYEDWAFLDDGAYRLKKKNLIDQTLDCLETFIPKVRQKIDHIEAATPRTVEHYTQSFGGSSFGTKFEGLGVSTKLPEQIRGLFHAGSVGIIMSGWLGTVNYGVIVADKVDRLLRQMQTGDSLEGATA